MRAKWAKSSFLRFSVYIKNHLNILLNRIIELYVICGGKQLFLPVALAGAGFICSSIFKGNIMTDFVLLHEPAIRLGFFFGMLTALAGWEVLAPRRVLTISKPGRWTNNLGI